MFFSFKGYGKVPGYLKKMGQNQKMAKEKMPVKEPENVSALLGAGERPLSEVSFVIIL